jgi:hypothetical protein
MFWYSFTAAVLHRDDTTDVMMPPPYEVYPYFFVESDIIQKAYKYWMMRKADCTFCSFTRVNASYKCSGLHVEHRAFITYIPSP